MKKLFRIIIAVTFALALSFNSFSYEHNYTFAEESTFSQSEDVDKPDKKKAGAGEILLIIGIFTLSFACSGVITYRMRRKSSELPIEENVSSDFKNKDNNS